jgi:hypothetical protein
LFTSKCPVSDRERTWIDENFAWLRREFGDGALHGPVILPTSTYFPPPFSGSEPEVRGLVAKVAGFMGVQAEVAVELSDDIDHAAGTYTTGAGGRPVITIDRSSVTDPGSSQWDPVRLVAVIAHELGHVRLLGEGRIEAGREDGEPLTDLATVFLGLGIFTANAAFEFIAAESARPRTGGWSTERLGYLTEQMYGYALARYAVARGEEDPPWARYLDTNPRVYMKHGVHFLRHAGDSSGMAE